MLCWESDIDFEVVAERGYYSATSPAEVPEEFANYQRRRTGLVFRRYSPDGTTTYPQLRPERPRTDRKTGKPIKYENPENCPTILDVHPRNLARLSDSSEPLWVCEGTKGGDSLTSRGCVAVSLQGVWQGFRKISYRQYELIPCWDYIALQGRRVYLVFDADLWTNSHVLQALRILAELLEDRGAQVLVAIPPPVMGESTGVDDYLGAGGSAEHLEELARPFDADALRRERVISNPSLRRSLKILKRIAATMPTRNTGDYSRRSLMRVAVDEARENGRTVEDGVQITLSVRDFSMRAQLGKSPTSRNIERLISDGYMRREEQPKGAPKNHAATYVLLTRAVGGHNGEGKREGVTFPCHDNVTSPSLHSVPLLRAPRAVPELRWGKVKAYADCHKVTGERKLQYEYLRRIGKRRGEILAYLVAAGGVADVEEVWEHFGARGRLRDFKRRNFKDLQESYIVTLEGDLVRLSPEWELHLDQARLLGEEYEDEKLQREKYSRQREEFRTRHKRPEPDPVPEMPVADDRRKHWSDHPEWCACRECAERFGAVIGEHAEGCACGACCRTTRRTRETVPVWAEEADDWRNHTLGCECGECTSSLPTYARARSS